MNLEQLETFLAIARHRSFSRAASEHKLTQPGLSRQIQRLEKELGVELLQRHRSRLELTLAGEKFRLYAENVLSQHREFLAALRQGTMAMEGKLRIASSMAAGEFLVPELISRFTALHPGVKPEIFVTDSSHVVAELRERRWDIGFVGKQIQGRGLQYDIAAQDEIVLAVPASHPFSARGVIKLAELEGQTLIEANYNEGASRSVRMLLAKLGMTLPAYRVATSLSSSRAILLTVERGYGIGWVSLLALGSEWNGRVYPVRLAGLLLKRPLYLVKIKQRPLPYMAGSFVDWLFSEAGISVSTLKAPALL